MKKFHTMMAAAVLTVGSAGAANAALIDFDSFAAGANIHGVNLGGVTITGTDGVVGIHASGSGGVGYTSPFNAIAASSWDAGRYLTLTFDSLVNSVSIMGGDAGGDADRWSLEAFDTGGTSIGFADTGTFSGADPVTPLTTTFVDYRTLSLAAAGIKTVKLTQVTWGSAWDNLVFDGGPSVPEPTSLALMGLGLAAFGFSRRKKAQ